MSDVADLEQDEALPSGRPRRARWVLGCCGAVFLLAALCCGGCFWLYRRAVDPALAATRFQTLLPCTVPPGYTGNLSVDTGGLRFAALAPQGSPPGAGAFTIGVVLVPPTNTPGQAQAQLAEGLTKGMTVTERGEITATVRGKPLKGEQLLATNQQGQPLKIVFLTVPRQADDPGAGTVLLVAGGKLASFDDAAWKALLDSIE